MQIRLGRELAAWVSLGAVLLDLACDHGFTRAPSGARGGSRPPTEWTGVHGRGAMIAASPIAFPKTAWVLHIGDSFVNSLQASLGPKFRAAGARYIVRQQRSTYTTTWANRADFDELLSRGPSLVIVTLGANEFDIASPQQHARAIESIARKIARVHASCVWTAPPMWRPDTGISQVIHDHAAPCLFFDSDALLGSLAVSERRADHIHPNERGGARWAEAFWRWLPDHLSVDAGRLALTSYERIPPRDAGQP